MNRISAICVLGGVVFLTGLAGCKTEVNNPPAQNTVVREERVRDSGPERVNVNVHDHSSSTPPVQNNIKVDR